VEDYDLVVGRKPQVAFDACVKLERGGKCDQAVFWKSRVGMKAPVREAFGTGIEGIRR
jgi:hypothetical protein